MLANPTIQQRSGIQNVSRFTFHNRTKTRHDFCLRLYVMVCSTIPPYHVHVCGTVIKGLRETGRGWVRYKGREGIVWGLVGV